MGFLLVFFGLVIVLWAVDWACSTIEGEEPQAKKEELNGE